MAIEKTKSTPQITLVGQSESGKTNLLATLLGNNNAHLDLGIGPMKVVDVSWTAATGGAYDDKNVDALMSYANNILRGQVLSNPGSDEVKIYPCRLRYSSVERVRKRGGFMWLGSRYIEERIAKATEVKFNIVDGRGGDIAPKRHLDAENPNDAEAIGRQAEYRERLNESQGAVVIMPVDKDGFKIDLANRLVSELMRTIEYRKGKSDLNKLRNISLCYTKYDQLFTGEGATAGEKAADLDRAVDYLKDEAIVRVFERIYSLAESDPELNVAIFPVSTFGFVDGTGVANFYDWKDSPGLLTRAVSGKRDWNNPKLPQSKDHFPFEISENEAMTLWCPFNIAPPLFFALTGLVTGPLYLYPEDLLSKEMVNFK